MNGSSASFRLNGRQWLWVALVSLAVISLAPAFWKRLEPFAPQADYRIPYQLSDDYWLYQRRVAAPQPQEAIYVVGDSVIWGEYVLADGTLSHFLNQEAGSSRPFINAGVNGLFPLALDGLINHYGGPIQRSKVILHVNLLWMSSPKADLNVTKEETFNHVTLVPQFHPRIPCYKAGLNSRLARVIRRTVPFFGWVDHLQYAYFDQRNILMWTLVREDGSPPRFPNTYRNPLARISLHIPKEPVPDPERGPASVRHRSWSEAGLRPSRFSWVAPESSLQWAALKRLIEQLRDRENDLFVVVGPFNEHMLTEDGRAGYQQWRDTVVAWLEHEGLPHAAPAVLPSQLYGDASHPLTEGYARLAKELTNDQNFAQFVR